MRIGSVGVCPMRKNFIALPTAFQEALKNGNILGAMSHHPQNTEISISQNGTLTRGLISRGRQRFRGLRSPRQRLGMNAHHLRSSSWILRHALLSRLLREFL